MEGLFLLSELKGSSLEGDAARLLVAIASSSDLVGNESRQAAIWGLGRAGLGAYAELIAFLDVEDENERIHALVALGPKLPVQVVRDLVSIVGDETTSGRRKASALYVLSRLSDVSAAARQLSEVATGSGRYTAAWALATLGCMEPEQVRHVVHDAGVLEDILPLQLLSSGRNWTRNESALESLNFVQKQTVFGS
jgi:HEAT repeat protein